MTITNRCCQSCVFTGIIRVAFRHDRRRLPNDDHAFFFLQLSCKLRSNGHSLRNTHHLRCLQRRRLTYPGRITSVVRTYRRQAFGSKGDLKVRLRHFNGIFFRVVTSALYRNMLRPFFREDPLSPNGLKVNNDLPLSSEDFYHLYFHFRTFNDFCRTLNDVKAAIRSRVLCTLRCVDKGVNMGGKNDQVSSARVRTLTSNVMGRCNVRHLTGMVVTTRERKGIARSSASVHAKRVLTCPSNNASGICDVVIILIRANYRNGCVQIRGCVVKVRACLIRRGAMYPFTSLGLAFMHIYLPFFVGDRRRNYHAVLLSNAHVLRRFVFPLLRKSKISSKLTLRTFRSNRGRFPLEKICRSKSTNGLQFQDCRVRRDHRLRLDVRRSIIRVCVSSLHAIFRLLTNGTRHLIVFLFVGRARRFTQAHGVATFARVRRIVFQLRFRGFGPKRPGVFQSKGQLVKHYANGRQKMLNGMNVYHSTAAASGVRRSLVSVLFCFVYRVNEDLIMYTRAIKRSNIKVDASVVEYANDGLLRREFRLTNTGKTIRPG